MEKDIWYNNPEILIKDYKCFFPNEDTYSKNANASVRLSIYIAIVLLLYTNNIRYILLPLAVMVITYMYKTKETFQDKKIECTKPTSDNPFMNYNHVTDNYHKPPACEAFLYDDPESIKVREEVTDKFNTKLYRDVGDLYSRRNSQREFYTVAYNGIPDQTSFAKWLYGQDATCKENSVKCASWTG